MILEGNNKYKIKKVIVFYLSPINIILTFRLTMVSCIRIRDSQRPDQNEIVSTISQSPVYWRETQEGNKKDAPSFRSDKVSVYTSLSMSNVYFDCVRLTNLSHLYFYYNTKSKVVVNNILQYKRCVLMYCLERVALSNGQRLYYVYICCNLIMTYFSLLLLVSSLILIDIEASHFFT